MALKKSELYSSLWQSCDELRGGMDASQYKDYVLVLLFMKYVSDKAASGKLGEAQDGLTAKVAAQYGKLTEDEIKKLVVEDKWLAALEQRREKNHALKQGMMQELLTGRRRLV